MNTRIAVFVNPLLACVLAGLLALIATLTALTPVAAAEECPNAALRTGPSAHLPDCRAYELVSPSYKASGAVAQEPVFDPDGQSVLLQLKAAVDGSEGFANFFSSGASLSGQRTASGWTYTADEPPASLYEPFLHNGLSNWMGTDLDAQTNVYPERTAAQAENQISFVERLPNHSIAEVGPALPPSAPSVGSLQELGDAADVFVPGMSADGSRLFFDLARFFWPGDETEELVAAGNEGHIHSLYEYMGTGNTTPLLVGVDDEGKQISQCGTLLGWGEPNGGSSNSGLLKYSHNAISRDGNTVFFTAFPDDYNQDGCTASAPPVAEIYARIDNGLPGAHTVAISEPSKEDCAACDTETGVLANAYFLGASVDGSKVLFETTQPLLGGDTSTNLYEYDLDAPAGQRIVHVSGGDSTVQNPTAEVLPPEREVVEDEEPDPLISENGADVYFLARGVLTKTPNAQGETAEQGAANLYVFERDAAYPAGRIAFIAQLSAEDMFLWNRTMHGANVSADGRFLVFTSNRDLTPDDTSTAQQVFEYDAQSGVLTRVSIGQDGFNHNGNVLANEANNASLVAPFYEFKYEADAIGKSSVSADGSYVFFESSVALTPQALNGSQNVYEYHDGRVSLISDGQDTTGAALLGTDESGADVFFATSDQLAPQDTDTNIDIYDARIDGGFPAPASPSCEGEACQGALSGAPTLLSPGSEFQAGGNPRLAGAPAGDAAKGGAAKAKVKRKSRVKSKKRDGKTGKRAAGLGRGRRKAGRS